MKQLLIISLPKMSDFWILFSSGVAFVASPDHERRRERKCDVSKDSISHRKCSVFSISSISSILNIENFIKCYRNISVFIYFCSNLQICNFKLCAFKKKVIFNDCGSDEIEELIWCKGPKLRKRKQSMCLRRQCRMDCQKNFWFVFSIGARCTVN